MTQPSPTVTVNSIIIIIINRWLVYAILESLTSLVSNIINSTRRHDVLRPNTQ